MTLAATLSLDDAAKRSWPAVVVGAGPAGAIAARELARRGVAVLLVDRAAFPRAKVCGSCLNGQALGALAVVGLGALPGRLGAVPVEAFTITAGGRAATLPLRQGVVISREAFDAALVGEAIEAGAAFLPLTSASVLPETGGGESRRVFLRCQGVDTIVNANLVLAAGGLGGTEDAIEPGSRVGLGTIVDSDDPFYRRGVIRMCCGGSGYVGLVRLEDGRLDLAAAVDVRAVRDFGGPARIVSHLLKSSGWHVPRELADSHWRGTAALTRRAAHIAGHRLLVVGDATGYVEPFTGEGMAWALSSGAAVADLAAEGARNWRPELARAWASRHRRLVTRRQWVCRAAAAVLRRPALAALAVASLSWLPWLSRPVLARLNHSTLLTLRDVR